VKKVGDELDEGGVGFAVVGAGTKVGDIFVVADGFEFVAEFRAWFGFDRNRGHEYILTEKRGV